MGDNRGQSQHPRLNPNRLSLNPGSMRIISRSCHTNAVTRHCPARKTDCKSCSKTRPMLRSTSPHWLASAACSRCNLRDCPMMVVQPPEVDQSNGRRSTSANKLPAALRIACFRARLDSGICINISPTAMRRTGHTLLCHINAMYFPKSPFIPIRSG